MPKIRTTAIAVSFIAMAVALGMADSASAQPAQQNDILPRIVQLTEKVTPTVVRLRREFHAHPELSNREEQTAAAIASHLEKIGVDRLETGVGRHGVVALIRGGRPGPTIALRADIDALPIQEATGLPFASKNEGVMHACGHDAHAAMLLGAAEVLVGMRSEIRGSVKLIFQPAEEGAPPGEPGGAKLMIEEGVLEKPDVEAIFGMHVNPESETGELTYRFGGLMASVDRFRVTITGKQSHAAMPWQGVDPIVAASHVVTAIQTIASRKVDTRQAVVVSIGIFRGGQAWNIIPNDVLLEGTIRSHEPEVRGLAVAQFRKLVEQTAAAHGATARIEMTDYGPVVWNDPELGKQTLPSLVRAAGQGRVVESLPIMGGEDFAHYAQKIPGFYLFLGVRGESAGAVHALHNPRFTVDESALPLGVRAYCLMALDYLCRQADKPGK